MASTPLGPPFEEVQGVSEESLEVLKSLGFVQATPVQAATIPPAVGAQGRRC